MTETNLPAFAQTLAAVPKRLRKGLDKTQHGRTEAMLIAVAYDPTKFIGRLIKKGRRRYSFEVFKGFHTEETVSEAQVVHGGRVSTPLRGVTLARQYHQG